MEAGGEGGGGEKEVGGDESQRRLDIRNVGDMSGLFNAISSAPSSAWVDYTGNNIITNGDVVEVALGTYQCNESGTNCASGSIMLYPNNLHGIIECTNDSADCIIDGESSRRVIYVEGSGSGLLTIRALTFLNGQHIYGGGAFIDFGAKVDFILCLFQNCRATGTCNTCGGGAIYIGSIGEIVTINIYATRFTGNTADSEAGNDIRYYGKVIIHDECPEPYKQNYPTEGKARK